VEGYAKLAAEAEECEIDKELAKKAQNSQRIKWDHQAVIQQQAKLEELAKRDPELGQPKLKAYKLECQGVACKEG